MIFYDNARPVVEWTLRIELSELRRFAAMRSRRVDAIRRSEMFLTWTEHCGFANKTALQLARRRTGLERREERL